MNAAALWRSDCIVVDRLTGHYSLETEREEEIQREIQIKGYR